MSHSLVVLWRLVSPEHPLLAKGQHWHPRPVSTGGPDLLEVALPGVGLRGFPWSRPDLVESFQGVGVQLHRHSAEVRVQLLDR
jgi:hypothetical protein